ncbi:TPA: D-alanyl-lipoteichoic acid biosynthesis protein DltD [Streptococcus agalactiae]|nr:D-alanyl-lipoteichoic acid biosynthesis protein DltD [Streptococcus agalactiae]HEN9900057.1 D-alanyl-lipoteichoic acid biosynthesis protein DltD [Streptococcus agalactiae]
MLKRLGKVFGPLVCALLLLVGLYLVFPVSQPHHLGKEKNSAVALTKAGFKSRVQKVRAFSDPKANFVPFFGSSEWLRFDAMHPSVLAEAYKRPYIPYLLGQKGAASLTQYYGIQQIKGQIKNKKAIYVISPQWFVRKGANKGAFQNYFSNDQTIRFLQNQTGTTYDRYAARRLLKLYPEASMSDLIEKVADGQKLSNKDKQRLKFNDWVFEKTDAIFSYLPLGKTYNQVIMPHVGKLPKAFSYNHLSRIASQDAKVATRSNQFGIDDCFYQTRIKKHLKKLKGSQRHFNYTKSPEFNDLQLVLNEFSKQNTDVLFVIPPVNKKWTDYTGLDQKMYQKSVEKIKHQLQSQGFNHISDLSRDGGKPYFMQDTIHLGWNGWLELDKHINPFLTEENSKPNYHINNKFLKRSWAKYTGRPSDYK